MWAFQATPGCLRVCTSLPSNADSDYPQSHVRDHVCPYHLLLCMPTILRTLLQRKQRPTHSCPSLRVPVCAPNALRQLPGIVCRDAPVQRSELRWLMIPSERSIKSSVKRSHGWRKRARQHSELRQFFGFGPDQPHSFDGTLVTVLQPPLVHQSFTES